MPNVKRYLIKQLLRNHISTTDTILRYRERIFNLIALTFLVTGLFALIAGLYASFKFKMYEIAVIDCVAYSILIFIYFNRSVSLNMRKILLMTIPFILGVFFMFTIGPESPGFAFLVGFVILGALLMGYRTTLYALAITMFTLLLITGIIFLGLFPTSPIHGYTALSYFAAGINMVLIGSVSSLPLAYLVRSLEKKMQMQERLQNLLRKNIKELSIAKQKAEESNALKTAFLQNISHEIRTPLNAILGFTDILGTQFRTDDTIKNYTSIITGSGNDLLDIINDVLDISKIESGQLTIDNSVCTLENIFKDIEYFFNGFTKRINKKGIQLLYDVNFKDFDFTMSIDEVKLKQVLINLISNALKFTDKGSIKVGCHLETENMLCFYVKDTGIGIPKEKQKDIFKRFVKIASSNARLYGGTGLGLSIVKGILDLLGGTIWIESNPNAGSTFYFNIPFTKAINPLSPKKESGAPQLTNKRTLKILIVEDNPVNLDYLKHLFATSNHDIKSTDNGDDAIFKVKTSPFDLILLDIRLPNTNGYAVARKIRENNSEVKIIAQTAYAAQEDRQKALAAGCNDYLSKPINKALLFAKINTLFNS